MNGLIGHFIPLMLFIVGVIVLPLFTLVPVHVTPAR